MAASMETMYSKIDAVQVVHTHLMSGRKNIELSTNNRTNVLQGYDVFSQHLMQAHVDGNLSVQDIGCISQAVLFAAYKHAAQTRKDAASTPYIIHPIGVADNILEIGKVYNVNILIGALLHDTVEDTDTSFEELEQHFGKTITALVREVTDDKALSKEERKRLQIEHAKHTSPEAAVIKLSDKLYNLKDLTTNTPAGWPAERVAAYFTWSQSVVTNLPAANEALKQAVDETIATFRSMQPAA